MTESIKDMGVSGKYTRMEHPKTLHLLHHLEQCVVYGYGYGQDAT
ncbi:MULTISPECIES: hypothetical protein [unclassified Paenibacillus]|nr:hypothetical protein [Paenibacillus sp. VTT E-133280]